MTTPSQATFSSLDRYDRLQELIDAGEAEGQFLECKAPHSALLDKGLKSHLADCLSGFANSGGGVIVWGVSTDSHKHSGLDVLTQVEPIGNCRALAQRIDRTIPALTIPSVPCPPSRVLLLRPTDTKGVVVTYVPSVEGDPVQTVEKKQFLIRIGADLADMPYETLKRMFTGTGAPDLSPIFDNTLVKREQDGSWIVPILITNAASKATEHVSVWVTPLNPSACDRIASRDGLQSMERFNPGKVVFNAEITQPIYRGPRHVVGALQVVMKKQKRLKRVLNLQIELYSSNMRARAYQMRVQLAKKGFSVREVARGFLY